MGKKELFERIRFRGAPQAHPDCVVLSGQARFTVLSARLIRLEWSEAGLFEDRGTYAFPTRYSEQVPAFQVTNEGDFLVIDTGSLLLRYAQGSGKFTPENLSIAFDLGGERQVWKPGMPSLENLRGTRRTLDNCEGAAALEEGLFSRAGWSLFDDSVNVIFTPEDGWVGPRPDFDLQDWYFFGYGHDFTGGLADYVRFGGDLPLIPRFILGSWWSRYWAYSDQDLKDLVHEFEEHDVPLDVLVIDIDWHTPDAWTGYTWNRELFPDPPAFLKWAHAKGLRTTLNLHPAQGVQAFEEIYPRFAAAMNLDPQSGEAVPFHIADKRFVKHYFEMLHHPQEDDGVDFWWMDWQQGEVSEVKGLDPLSWLNHLHFNDIKRLGQRPMLYSRWGGLGNHRYYIGFSGDTVVTWDALAFQPYFTATAANVAYGWWSHDIGGHMGGETPPELYARWVQYGALSPTLRLHSTKDERCERRPWAYPEPAYQAAKDAFHLRYRLIPYLYTLARKSVDTAVSLCYPMYYDYPEAEAAYAARYQYFFGDQMIAAPIVHPADPQTGMATQDVWIPKGLWIDAQSKESFSGPCWVRLVGDLDRIPMLMKAGAILPMAAPFAEAHAEALTSGSVDALPRDQLVLAVYPGAAGQFRLYEDDGVSEDYQDGQSEWTEIRTSQADAQTWEVHVAAVEGHCDVLPEQRGYEIRLEGSACPVQVLVDGELSLQWSYDAPALRTTIEIPQRPKSRSLMVRAVAEGAIVALGEAHDRAQVLADVRRLLGEICPADPADIDSVAQCVCTGRESALARLGAPFASFIELSTPEDAAQQVGRVIVSAPADGSSYDVDATFTRECGGQREARTVTYQATAREHIIAVPFAVDQVQSQRWQAEVVLRWRGITLRSNYASEPYFPAVYAWRMLVYRPDEAPLDLGQVLAADGTVREALSWKTRVQLLEEVPNVKAKHHISFWREYREALVAGEKLASYVTTKIISPEAREACLEFATSGAASVYLNAEAVAVDEPAEDAGQPAHFPRGKRTQPLSLRAGENTLLLHLSSPPKERPHWFFGARMVTLDGDLMLDLQFEA